MEGFGKMSIHTPPSTQAYRDGWDRIKWEPEIPDVFTIKDVERLDKLMHDLKYEPIRIPNAQAM
jgi:hypothetical protein